MKSIREIVASNKGQALVELTLLSPLLLLLAYGSIEVGNVISTYITLTHTTREGANLASRGTDVNVMLDAITAAAAPTIRDDNSAHWKIIYSKVVQDPGVPCAQAPCVYKVASQTVRGGMGQSSKLGPVNQTVTLDGINSVGPGQTFHVVEVFFDYQSVILTFVGNDVDTTIYDRTVFTNVSSAG
jgi:Flp pilus assembly protein TadG